MEITNSLEVPLPPDEAWRLLLDIPRIMPCVPGAELIEAVDDKTFKGKVSVRLGPVALSFVGVAKFEELDAVAKRARVSAKGSDAKGRGGADAVVRFELEPAGTGAGTIVTVVTTVNLTGSVAQYGRGTGIIQGVATQLTAQFARNLQAMLEQPDEDAPGLPAPADIPAPAIAAPPPPPVTAIPSTTAVADGGDFRIARMEAAAARSEAAAARVEAAVARVEAALTRLQANPVGPVRSNKPPAAQAKPISGVALMGSVAWNMVTGAFSRNKATS